MINEEFLVEQLKRHEGIRLKPYHCTSNKLTIGIGRNLDDVGISNDEAEYLLRNDIADCIDKAMSLAWFNDAPEAVQSAVVNLIFNMGFAKLCTFKLTLGHLERGEYELAGAELLNSRYAQQVGQRAVEIANQIAECQE